MSGVIATSPRFNFTNALGVPLSFGSLTTYIAGSTTPETTYQDLALTVANTNPIVLDAAGSCLLWLDSTKVYKFLLKDSAGVTVPGWPVDNISGASSVASLSSAFVLKSDLANVIDPTKGSAMITGGVQHVNTLTELRSLSKNNASKFAEVAGYPYYLDVADTTSADNNGSLIVANDGARWKFVTQNKESNGFFTQNGARIARFGDRVFMGAAVKCDGAFPNVSKDWLSEFQNSLGYDSTGGGMTVAQVGILNDSSNSSGAALYVGARSKNFTAAGTAALGITGYALNNNTTYRTDAWAFYGEAHLVNNNAGSTYAMEMDVRTVIDSLPSDPYRQGNVVLHQMAAGCGIGSSIVTGKIDNGSGSAGNILTVTSVTTQQIGGIIKPGSIVSGVGVTSVTVVLAILTGTGGVGTYTVNQVQLVPSERLVVSADQYDSSAAVQIVANAMRFKIGINFFADSLSGCDGVTGVGTAIGMARGHELAWYQQSSQKTSYIRGTSTLGGLFKTGVLFDDNGFNVADSAGNPIIRASSSGSIASNYILFQSGISGSALVSLLAQGTDASIDLYLGAKGVGVVRFGAYTAGTVAQAGYITIKDAGGTARRLLVG